MTHLLRGQKAGNPDIVDTLRSKTDLEDEVCSQVGQLDALCAAQLTIAMEGANLSAADFLHYSQVMRSYSHNLRLLIEELYC